MFVKEIKEKIEFIKQSQNFSILHNPKAKEKQLIKFEERFSLTLPHDYKEFLLEIGNGGFELNPLDLNSKSNNKFFQDFPFSKKTPDENDEDYVFELEKTLFGQIPLWNIGCGSFYFLVIRGNEYGNVWLNNIASNHEISPCAPIVISKDYNYNNKNRISFSEWYLENLSLRYDFESSKFVTRRFR